MMHRMPTERPRQQPRKHPTVRVRVGRSTAGLGLFADEPLKRGQLVIEYIGYLLTSKEADERGGKYLFELSSRRTIDGTPRWNTARYINHSCDPNCETTIDRGHVLIHTRRAVARGEELTYDYGTEYYNDFIKPHGCRCGASLHLHEKPTSIKKAPRGGVR